jgi:hypothetical protein
LRQAGDVFRLVEQLSSLELNYGVVDVLCVSNGFLVGVIDMAEKGLGAL